MAINKYSFFQVITCFRNIKASWECQLRWKTAFPCLFLMTLSAITVTNLLAVHRFTFNQMVLYVAEGKFLLFNISATWNSVFSPEIARCIWVGHVVSTRWCHMSYSRRFKLFSWTLWNNLMLWNSFFCFFLKSTIPDHLRPEGVNF